MRLIAFVGFPGLLTSCDNATSTSALKQQPGDNTAPSRAASVAQGGPNKSDAIPRTDGATRPSPAPACLQRLDRYLALNGA